MIYALVGLRGPVATVLKFALLGAVDAFLIWILSAALNKHSIVMVVVLLASLAALNGTYLVKGAIPLKFMIVGIIFFAIFVVTPTGYTILMSGYNYKTGNEIDKQSAITGLLENGLAPDAAGTTYDMLLGKSADGQWVAILNDVAQNKLFYATVNGVTKISESEISRDATGKITGGKGIRTLSDSEFADADTAIGGLRFPIGDGSFASPQGVDVASRLTQSFVYDKKTDTLTNNDLGLVYVDNGKGNFALKSDMTQTLDPGWRAFAGFDNFKSLIMDKNLRDPFIKVFIWTVLFAFLSVGSTFVVGMLLALALQTQLRFRRFYRGFLILPYAIPSFMSILIWRGLFNKNYGAINHLLHTHIGWFDSTWTARGAVLLVNLWLGFTYMYLISSGALQSIPAELEEAAAIDGATGRQAFVAIKLPLLLQVLGPLLISSFAFNFNNFNIIFLLTGGGPTNSAAGEVAGGTDILISYAYKTAFGNTFQNLGLSSAISIVMFFIVGVLSMYTLKKSRVLESL